jgi:hypothetical protein
MRDGAGLIGKSENGERHVRLGVRRRHVQRNRPCIALPPIATGADIPLTNRLIREQNFRPPDSARRE